MGARTPQKRLGRGLSALLGEYADEDTLPSGDFQQILVSEIRPNPFQPRSDAAPEKLEELAVSIRENGLLQPVIVRPAAAGDGGWELVAGERRWRAVSKLGWTRIAAAVRHVDDGTMIVLALIENLEREDLTPLDEALAYRRLMQDFGLTQADVAARVGRDRSTVANTVRLLALPDAVLELLAAGKITAGHARALLGLDSPGLVIELARQAAATGLSVREVERRVRSRRMAKRGEKAHPKMRDPGPYGRKVEQALAHALGTAVRVRLEGGERGRLEIPFRDADDFQRIAELIVGVGGIV